MNAAFLTVALLVAPSAGETGREVNPLAPSLPVLTREEEERIERVIERFILWDIGKLPAKEGPKAQADLKALGPGAIPQLIDGLNRAALMQSSCPAVILGRKLSTLLNASEDVALLDYARENIGAGVNGGRHMGVIKDLRLGCILRKSALQRAGLTAKARPAEKTPRSMTTAELVRAAGSERGPLLKAILVELGERQNDQAMAALGSAAGSYDGEIGQLAQGLLLSNLARQSATAVRDRLKADQPQVRAAAAKVIGDRSLPYGGELIELLNDSDAGVRLAARQALVRLSGGQDYGPESDASATERTEAVRQWRDWWDKQSRR